MWKRVSIVLVCLAAQTAHASPVTRYVDPYYPDEPRHQLKLNYYYDRTGRWVKFSDWIPYKRRMTEPVFFEDFYQMYGLAPHYGVQEVQESIYYLVMALSTRFRHPTKALCQIRTEAEYAKYRNLMHMQTNLLIMRMFLRLGSLYDKRHLYFHDLDVADDLSVSFGVARAYYEQAKPYWALAQKYAARASEVPIDLDLPGIESERYRIMTKKTDFGRIIDTHIANVDAKSAAVQEFLKKEGTPRPVKSLMQKDIESMYNDSFTPDPLSPPRLGAEPQGEL
jgi:hypothetical protein